MPIQTAKPPAGLATLSTHPSNPRTPTCPNLPRRPPPTHPNNRIATYPIRSAHPSTIPCRGRPGWRLDAGVRNSTGPLERSKKSCNVVRRRTRCPGACGACGALDATTHPRPTRARPSHRHQRPWHAQDRRQRHAIRTPGTTASDAQHLGKRLTCSDRRVAAITKNQHCANRTRIRPTRPEQARTTTPTRRLRLYPKCLATGPTAHNRRPGRAPDHIVGTLRRSTQCPHTPAGCCREKDAASRQKKEPRGSKKPSGFPTWRLTCKRA